MKQYFQQFALVVLFFLFFYGVSGQDKITSAQPFSLSEKYLDKLVKLIGDKRIVSIGEDTHGTQEFYQFREALTKKLIREKGFNVFILENPHEDLMALEEGLYKENIDTLMRRHLFSIYQTEEMKSFLNWVKTSKRSVRLAGCDDSYRDILPGKLRKEIAKYKVPLLDSLANDFFNRQTLSAKEYYQLPGHTIDKIPGEIQYGYGTYLITVKLDSIVRSKKINDRRLLELVFHARSNYEVYRALKNKQFVSRDSLMAARVNWFAANKANKVIVWAHNAHITRKSLDEEIGKMGEIIKLQNPNQYFAIGLTTAGGSYSYMTNNFINDDHNYTDTLFSADLLPMKENSWHADLKQVNLKDFYIPLGKVNKQQAAFFGRVKPFRAIGYKKENPEKAYFNASLLSLYDLVVFYRTTHATTPLGNK